LTGPAWAGLRVGLLGGSFNPAHQGHLHVSLMALRHLDLDQVWWLVSPQNPLKPTNGMAPFRQRFASARAEARHPRIIVSDLERRLGTRFTSDTLAALGRRYPDTRFVWLMGADNLGQIHRWQHWRSIFESTAIAVFDRAPYRLSVLAAPAARAYGRWRVIGRNARPLARMAPPAWTFFITKLDTSSSTAIRLEQDRLRSLQAEIAQGEIAQGEIARAETAQGVALSALPSQIGESSTAVRGAS
jgi:nicotinate-nucleotide adenylyltransferase